VFPETCGRKAARSGDLRRTLALRPAPSFDLPRHLLGQAALCYHSPCTVMHSATEDNTVKLVLTGDLHLGRSSSRVSAEGGHDELRATAAWERIVELAIREGAAAVCLSGDVVDEGSKFWEAIGALEAGVGRLGEAGIQTVAVAGNHDFDVLARLADELPGEHFVLLGRGGNWERFTLKRSGQPAVHLDGWSFATQQVRRSPLDDYALPDAGAVPVLGMVHGDLGVTDSSYAPLDLNRLRGLPPEGWLLGHLHAPRLLDGDRWVLYPGSPQALDPGEAGAHGPWVVEVRAGRMGDPDQRPLSTVWYESVEVDVGGVAEGPQLETVLLSALREHAERLTAAGGSALCHARLRVTLVGETPLSHKEIGALTKDVAADLVLPVGSGTLTVERLDVRTTPPLDLHEHAASHSALGTVARLLLALEEKEPPEDLAEVLRLARSAAEQADNRFAVVSHRELSEDALRELVATQARALLTELVAQNP